MKEMFSDSLLQFSLFMFCFYLLGASAGLPIAAAVLFFGSYFEELTPEEMEDSVFDYYVEQHPDAKPWETYEQETP